MKIKKSTNINNNINGTSYKPINNVANIDEKKSVANANNYSITKFFLEIDVVKANILAIISHLKSITNIDDKLLENQEKIIENTSQSTLENEIFVTVSQIYTEVNDTYHNLVSLREQLENFENQVIMPISVGNTRNDTMEERIYKFIVEKKEEIITYSINNLIKDNILDNEKQSLEERILDSFEKYVVDNLSVAMMYIEDCILDLYSVLHYIVEPEDDGSYTTPTLEKRLMARFDALDSICSNLSSSVTNIDTIETTCNSILSKIDQVKSTSDTLATDLSSMKQAILDMQNDITNSMQYIRDTGKYMEDQAPYNPPPDVIYTTRASIDVWRSFINSSTTLLQIPNEYFVISNGVPALLRIEFDFDTTENIEALYFDVYINEQIKFSKTYNITSGTTHILEYTSFELNATQGTIRLNIYSDQNTYKKVSNLHYEIEGLNAVFIREEPKNKLLALPCNNTYYLFKTSPHKVYYRTFSVNDEDLSGSYQTIFEGDTNYVYSVGINMLCSNGQTNFEAVCVTRLNCEDELIDLYNSDNNFTSSVVSFPNSTFYQKKNRLNMMQLLSRGISSTRFTIATYTETDKKHQNINISQTYSPSQSAAKTTTPVYINAAPYVNAATLIGKLDSYTFTLLQDVNGSWHIVRIDSIVSGITGLDIGFGTRVNMALVPAPIGQDSTNYWYQRVFMYVYDHWVVKYIRTNLGGSKLLSSKIIEGDYDQIINGTNRDYLLVKDGLITVVTDQTLQPVENFM